jgi:hypothetical protein
MQLVKDSTNIQEIYTTYISRGERVSHILRCRMRGTLGFSYRGLPPQILKRIFPFKLFELIGFSLSLDPLIKPTLAVELELTKRQNASLYRPRHSSDVTRTTIGALKAYHACTLQKRPSPSKPKTS